MAHFVDGKEYARTRGVAHSRRVAWKLLRLNLRVQMEYRANFLMTIVIGAVWQLSVIILAVVLLTRFPVMGSWTSRDVMLIAGVRMLSHGLYVLFFGRVSELPLLIQEGFVDAYILRPIPVYRQVQLSSFPVNALGDLIVAVSLFANAVVRSSIDWSPARVAFLGGAVLGGMLLEAAMFTALSSLTLYFATASYWTTWLDELMGTFGSYPLSILPRAAEVVLTFMVPLAFVAYFPAGVLSGNTDTLGVPAWVAAISPMVGAIAFLNSRLLWNWSLRRYSGANG